MILVALCSLLVAVVVAMSAAGLLRALLRQHSRDRDRWQQREKELLDRLMFLAGRTWTPPPREEPEPDPEAGRYVLIPPEQMPDDFDWDGER